MPAQVIIRGSMSEDEYRRLLGHLDELCVFARRTIAERASVTKTGARHARAKWLLVPKAIRAKFRGDEFDFDKVFCGAVEHNGAVCIIFTAPRRASPMTSGADDVQGH